MVRGALACGARFGELRSCSAAISTPTPACCGFILARVTTAARSRAMRKGLAPFTELAAGRPATAWMFHRADREWRHGEKRRPLEAAGFPESDGAPRDKVVEAQWGQRRIPARRNRAAAAESRVLSHFPAAPLDERRRRAVDGAQVGTITSTRADPKLLVLVEDDLRRCRRGQRQCGGNHHDSADSMRSPRLVALQRRNRRHGCRL